MKYKTIADIVAEKRRTADESERKTNEIQSKCDAMAISISQGIVANTRREADCIDAAHKREIEDAVRRGIGNSAKLREALKDIDRVVWFKKRHTKEEVEAHRIATNALTAANAAVECPPSACNEAKLRAALELCVGEMCKICNIEAGHPSARPCVHGCEVLKIAKAALAAPPRNCARFESWDAAEAEYNKLVAEGVVEDGTWCEWLFATAEEGGEK